MLEQIEELLCEGKTVAVWSSEGIINTDVTCEIYGFRQSYYKSGQAVNGLHAWDYDNTCWQLCEHIADDWRNWHFQHIVQFSEAQPPTDKLGFETKSVKANALLLDYDNWPEGMEYNPWIF